MTFVSADRLGFCWDVNAAGTWSTLTNWRRYETLLRPNPSDFVVSGAGASQIATYSVDNAGLTTPAILSFLNYGAGTLQAPTSLGTIDSRKCIEISGNTSSDVLQMMLPRAIALGVGEKLRLHVQIRVSASGNMSIGFSGANHSVAYLYITSGTTGVNDEFRTRNGSPEAGSTGTQVGTSFDFGVSFGTGARHLFFEIERTASGPDTFTLRFGLNNSGTTSVQTGITGLNFEDITRVVIRHEATASVRIGRVEVHYFPATASIQKPYAPNWAGADTQFEAYWTTGRTITIDAAYTLSRLYITPSGTHTLSGAGSLIFESATRDRVEFTSQSGINLNVPMTFKKHAQFDCSATATSSMAWGAGVTLEQGATFLGVESALNGQWTFHTSGNSFTGDIYIGSGAEVRVRDSSVFNNAKIWYLRDPYELTATNAGQRGRLTFGTTSTDVISVPADQTFWLQGTINGPRLLWNASVPAASTFAATIKLGYAPSSSASRGPICDIAVGNSGVTYAWILTGPVTGPTEASGNVPRLQAGSTNYAPRGGWNRRMEFSGNFTDGSASNMAFGVEYDNPGQSTNLTWVPTFVCLSGNNSHSGGGTNVFGLGTAATVVVHGTLLACHANALGVGVAQMGRSTGSMPNNYVSAILSNVAATIANNIDITHGSTSGYGVNVFEVGGYGAFASTFSGSLSLRGTLSGGTATTSPTHTCVQLHQNGNIVKDLVFLTGGSGYTSDPIMTFTAAPAGGRTALGKPQRLGGSSTVYCFLLIDPGDYPDGSTPTFTVSGGGGSTQATGSVGMTGLGGICTISGTILQNSLAGTANVIKTGTGKVRLTNAGSDYTCRTIVQQGLLAIGVTVASSGNSAVGNSSAGDVWIGDNRTVVTACRAHGWLNYGSYSASGGTAGTGQISGGTSTVDGVSLVAGDRVLVSHQTDPRQNGIYVVTATPTVWERATDLDTDGDLARGICVTITEGNRSAGTRWYLESYPTTLNSATSAGMIHFVQDDQVPNRPALLLESGITFGRGIVVKNTGGFMASATIGADSTGTVTFSGTTTLERDLIIDAPSSSIVVVSGVISGGFAIEKTSAGDLQLNATHTYTGTTTVSAGRLGGTGSTHASSAVSVSSGASIMGGTGSGNAGTFTVNGDLTFSSTNSRLAVNSTGAAASQVVVGGTVALGNCKVDLNNAMNTGTYDLIVATGVMSGTLPTIGTNNSGQSAALSQVGNTLRLTLT